PWSCQIGFEQDEFAALVVLHEANTADGKDECTDRGKERPRTRIDNMIIVVLLVRFGHVNPRKVCLLHWTRASPQSCPDAVVLFTSALAATGAGIGIGKKVYD